MMWKSRCTWADIVKVDIRKMVCQVEALVVCICGAVNPVRASDYLSFLRQCLQCRIIVDQNPIDRWSPNIFHHAPLYHYM
jgi:hypothetical protein